MAKVSLLLLCVFGLAAVKAETKKDDEMAALENDLEKIEEKREVKAPISDDEASKLLDELKKEVLNDAYVDLKNRFNGILEKKESDILSKQNSAAKKSAADAGKQDAENFSKEDESMKDTDEKFFKELESRADDSKDDPEAEKLIDMMANDLLTKEINEKSDEIQKKSVGSTACVDKRADCETLKNTGYCKSHKENMKIDCPRTCDMCACVDKINQCKFLADRGKCTKDKRMANFCPKSCGFCRAPSPPKCSKTDFGCCWDKTTTKLDKKGSNCPACNDHYRKVCNTFRDDCKRLLSHAGEFMIRHCARTCELCSDECKDDAKKSFYCKFWKDDLNWCKTKQEVMRHYCPLTCEFCG